MRFVSHLLPDSVLPKPLCRSAFGIPSLDAALNGGLPRECLHEIYATEVDDLAAAAGFAGALATGVIGDDCKVLWLRGQRASRLGGVTQANGWAELGGTPGACLFAFVKDDRELLRAAVDGLRCAALGAVIVESWGVPRELNLTASRRLALAAERSGVPLLLLRINAVPVPSAAQTRWQVTAAPSRALPGNAPGSPCFDVTLLRQRSGPCGLSWRLEWDRDQCRFHEAPLSGAVVPVLADRPAEKRARGATRQAA